MMQRILTLSELNSSSVWNRLVQGLSQEASGTEIALTDLPPWVIRATVLLANVRTSTSANKLIQLGSSGAFRTSGYVSSTAYHLTGTGTATAATGFGIYTIGPNDPTTAQAVLTRADERVWVCSLSGTCGGGTLTGGGIISLDGPLDSIRVVLEDGSEFVSGIVNVLLEG